jgi:ankyrin repeat protein/truncated hemoglobin YjbI
MTEDIFTRLGGRPAIDRIIDGLYDRLEADRSLRRLFGSRREGERRRQKLFFEGLFGGEKRGYADAGMQRRHVHRAISPAEAQRWLLHFDASMAAYGIQPALRGEVIDYLQPAALRLVNNGAPYEAVRAAVAMAGKGDLAAVMEAVARHPALLNQRAGDGVTMLWQACRRGRLDVVRWLVENGADPNIPGSPDHMTTVMVSPLCIALKTRKSEVGAYLRARGAMLDVFSASYLDDVEALAAILNADPALVSAESADEDFFPVTPLHHAVDGGAVAAATLLLRRGATATPFAGRLLTSAAAQGSLELVTLLLDRGADAREAESLGPLDGGHPIATLLLQRGLDLDRPVRGRETFLTRACRGDKGRHLESVRALLRLGAGPNSRNGSGRTPLHVAARGGFTGAVELLLAHGADPSMLDAGASTPLALALAAGRAEAAALLARRHT